MIKLNEADIKELADGNLKLNKYLNGLDHDELIQTLARNIEPYIDKLEELRDLNDEFYNVLERLNEYLLTHSTDKLEKIYSDLDNLHTEYTEHVLE